ncbi:MAG: HAMP domain-containing protein [Alphaproteobacteria bacterium]|nr:HAMP domain-containing protein [Alphaproteobacteria bacterium]
MKLLPRTLAGRTIWILLLGLSLMHLCSIWIYEVGVGRLIGSTREAQLAERLVSIARAVGERQVADRDKIAHALSSASVEAHWSPHSLVQRSGREGDEAEKMRARIRELALDLVDRGRLRLGFADEPGVDGSASPTSPHLLLASIQIEDGSWVNFSAALVGPGSVQDHGMFASATAMAVGILVVALILVRLITAPLAQLAQAARRLGSNVESPALSEDGPVEIRDAARAFNEMQERVRKLVKDRTETLAAISHDLKTPINRLRFRAELCESDELRRMITVDLDEMQAMIDGTLGYLREGMDSEPERLVDMAAILETLESDHVDAGHAVSLDIAPVEPALGRHLALKRALSNLMDNAVRYGRTVRVRLDEQGDQVRILIDDEGPGIPEDKLEAVFQPFYRLDESRGSHPAGTGLGLTVARTILRNHGGDVTLRNRDDGGLQAIVTLPRRHARG